LFSQASHNSRTTPTQPLALKAFHLIQHEYDYIPREAIPLLAGKFDTTPAIIFGTIDFYSEVHLDQPAENLVEWCSGPACLLKGSVPIRSVLESVLDCEMNRTSDDGKFELRLAQCDGTCHLAPLIRHEGKYLGPLSASDTIAFARRLKGEPTLEERLAVAAEEPATEAAEAGE
jgi:NADH:ubiquinone oxidoreductase subunit E